MKSGHTNTNRLECEVKSIATASRSYGGYFPEFKPLKPVSGLTIDETTNINNNLEPNIILDIDCGLTTLIGNVMQPTFISNVKSATSINQKYRIKAKIVDILPQSLKINRNLCTGCDQR